MRIVLFQLRWCRLAAIAAIVATLSGVQSPTVRAQQSGDNHESVCSSVQMVGETPVVYYQDFTQYDYAMNWGISAWQVQGIVLFIPNDQAPTLRYTDANLAGTVVGGLYSETFLGYYNCSLYPVNPFYGVIVFNTYFFDQLGFSDADKRRVGAHETGHALKIGDHHSPQYSDILMAPYDWVNWEGPDGPQVHDIDDYCAIWGPLAPPGSNACDNQTPTPPPTPTSAPTATPHPPGSGDSGYLRIHKRDGDGNPLDETCFRVTGPSSRPNVCDADDGVNDGETSVWDLLPGTYTVIETRTKPGYVRSPDPQTVTIGSGSAAEVTFVNEPVDDLDGELVYVYALKCGQNPGAVNVNDVAAGILPTGCALAPGVGFSVVDQDVTRELGPFVTDGSGRLSFRALNGHQLEIEENEITALPYEPVPGTNPRNVTVTANLRVVMVNTGGCTVSPAERQVGATVAVSCPGFDYQEQVTFYWDSEGTAPLSTVQANAAGTAIASFAVPRSTFGPHPVVAIGTQVDHSAGGVARVLPRLRICPGYGKVSDPLKLSLDGYAAHDIVTLRWYAGSTVGSGFENVWNSPPMSATGDAGDPANPCNSDATVTLPVPEGIQGVHRVEAVGAANVPHYQNFNVGTSMVLEPGAGPVGTNVAVHLRGFGADCPLTITWKWGAVTTTVGTTTTSAKGSADVSFVVPNDGFAYDHNVAAQRTGGGTCGSASQQFDLQ